MENNAVQGKQDAAVEDAVRVVAERAREAARALRGCEGAALNAALEAIAAGLEANCERILEANAADLARGVAGGMSVGLQDRLRLDQARVAGLADSVREVAGLPGVVGEVLWGRRLDNGLEVSQVRVPMGVVAMIYEARPDVTVNAAALCIKTGNAVILRGGSAAAQTNAVLVEVMREALGRGGLAGLSGLAGLAGVVPDAVQSLDGLGREAVGAVLRARGLVDLAIPRGGAGLIQLVVETATVPVIETGVGNCHIYVDASAQLEDAVRIVMNAKTQRVGVCNAVETLLVDRPVFVKFLRVLLPQLDEVPVRIHADADVAAVASQVGVATRPATEKDWETEYLDYDLAVRVVDGVDQAIAHIGQYSSGHTEAVLATDSRVIDHFVTQVDSAVVNVNASTRFTDGGQFGFGAEIGISTQKLHARGPMGMEALTTWKSIVRGQGQIRS